MMKIRLAIVAAVLAAAAACSNSPTAVDQHSPRSGSSILRDGSPPPDTSVNRGGGGLGSGN